MTTKKVNKDELKFNLERIARDNTNFRKVLYTAKHLQLVLMSLKPKEEIGMETHWFNDQFFRFEEGRGRVTIGKKVYDVKPGDAVIIPAETEHNIANISKTEKLKMYTIYAPKVHEDGTIQKNKPLPLPAVINDFDPDARPSQIFKI